MRTFLVVSTAIAFAPPSVAQEVRRLADLREVERTMDVQGTVFVRADDGVLGLELWRLGPGEQLELVKDIHHGPYGSGVYTSWAAFDATLFFSAADGTYGPQLWRSDGTAAGTVRVTRFGPSAAFGQIVRFGDGVAFAVDDGSSGGQVWFHDPVAGTTRQLTNLTVPALNVPGPLAVLRGELYFLTATNSTCRFQWCRQLWKTAATGSAPVLLASDLLTDYPRALVEFEGRLFFGAGRESTGIELMATDGTPAGTRVVADIAPGTASSVPSELTVSGGRLFFAANDGTSFPNRELWAFAGSMAVRVRDIRVGLESSSPTLLHDLRGTLLFYADDGVSGYEPWRSDGTAAGTQRVMDLVPGAQGSYLGLRPVSVGTRMYFVASDPTGAAIWVTDGTAANTHRVVHVTSQFCITTNLEGLASVCGRVLYQTARSCGGDLWSIERPGASVHVLGGACGGAARLIASSPQLGSTMTISGARAPVGLAAVSLLGLRLPQPTAILGCGVYLDVSSAVPLATFVVTQPSFSHPLPVPASPVLDGVTVATQTFFVAPTGQAATTNALCLTLGLQ